MPEKFNYEYVKDYIENLSQSNCKLLSDKYLNKEYKLVIQCDCGSIYERKFGNFKNKKQHLCVKCAINLRSIKNRKYSLIGIKEHILKNTKCKLLSTTYENAHDKLLLECHCGKRFETSFTDLRGNKVTQCKSCASKQGAEKQKHDIEDVRKYIENNSTSKLLSKKYPNSVTKISLLCECGREFKVTFHKFCSENKKRCNYCSKRVSMGEHEIIRYLDYSGINYVYEYSTKKCLGKSRPLKFDFAILDNMQNVCLFIEFDGQQHEVSKKWFGGEEKLQQQKEYDNIKTEFCKVNQIRLLRIPYSELKNIKNILNDIVKTIPR